MKLLKDYCLYICIVSFLFVQFSCKEEVSSPQVKHELPAIFPDYTEVTIPPSIAPLNFKVEGIYTKIDAVIEGNTSGSLHVQGDDFIAIKPKAWKQLLADNIGGSLKVTVSVKHVDGWVQYDPFNIYISTYPIDYGLTYRLIAPGYEVYSKMGIYQRNLSDFTQTALLENTLIPGNCMNCHSFCMANPEKMSLHIRGEYGATLLLNDGEASLLNTKTDQTISSCVYPYWHPSGKYIAYSVNDTKQVFHEVKDERVEVLDLKSDIVVYHIETNQLFSTPLLKSENAFETYPSFSPDGRTMYFCTADVKPLPEEYQQLRYSLCSIAFNPETGTFGNQVDTLVSAAKSGKSVSHPRPSYDGKYLMYTLADYGNFLVWHKEADLWLLDLATGETRELSEVNSKDADSYHCWSSNSRWFVFGSRRIDGLYTHPYIASVREDGSITKPFLLPQETPLYYEASLYSFNVPEFITEPVKMNISEVESKLLSKERKQMIYR
ncbi:hypothetical protein M2459_001220 [Parabacteroides sp. PF5-5]|uniref:TolB family protein n=1 Tax=unclassified Parabacteroides TaxID=2649774 RepID=UPI00247627C5|nr:MULTISPECIES: hypothetical protein [unclassified Parabacteroides]MDH6304487.1 hypothetical protein [Parabacteroides sp. PH5-39]MDH6315360.1 hypothetical protein [Parabacteroides sp. PF5-13]MDH6319146.1 hypothetical protein [Parabacteroides sp. PH5-13]MDH6322876.1 hypothetical protein [Parabacteroides sp. PH5-8]MDH6326552.1 hypothetical protein [Parabacteroides sp. PH5-41]